MLHKSLPGSLSTSSQTNERTLPSDLSNRYVISIFKAKARTNDTIFTVLPRVYLKVLPEFCLNEIQPVDTASIFLHGTAMKMTSIFCPSLTPSCLYFSSSSFLQPKPQIGNNKILKLFKLSFSAGNWPAKLSHNLSDCASHGGICQSAWQRWT